MPAVLAAPDSPPQLLTDARSVPLAVRRRRATPTSRRGTDRRIDRCCSTPTGLVERRDEPIDAGIARVAEVMAQTIEAPVDAVADAMLDKLAPAIGYDDDVAIVLYRHPGTALVIENRRDSSTVERRATSARRVASQRGCAETLAADIVLVVKRGVQQQCRASRTAGSSRG